LSLVLSGIGYFPSTMVMRGNALWESDLKYLRTQEILGDDEEILFFYSLGIWSIKEDGQFISNEYVTSYQTDPNDGSLYLSYIAYEDIDDINVEWAASWLDNTIITVTNNDGDAFEIWLSSESGGDEKFVREMKRLWKASSN